MAKARKSELTLEDAMVPVEEQPYEIPANWCWTRVKYISDVVTGSTPSKKNEEYYGGDFPFFKPADLDAGDNVVEASEYLSEEGKGVSRVIPELSTAVCCIGSIGKSGLLRVKGTTNQQINSMIPKINPLYLYYYSKTNEFVAELWEKSTATTISLVNKNNMETNTIPLAPLSEQKRIVEQIENLFSKLDEAKEKVQQVIDTYDDRRAAVLHDAFNGELTSDWRKKNNIDISSWKGTTISEIAELVTKGASPKWQGVEYLDDDTQTLFVTSENVREGYLDLTKEKYLDNKINDIQKRSVLKKGDVLVNIVGASIGRSAIYNIDKLANTNQAVCLIRLNDIELNHYVCFYLNSPVALMYYSDNKSETARANLSLADINNLPINIPSKVEANEIMKLVDSILKKERRALDSAYLALEQIDIMKKSILAKAFRGKLGTNIPEEESAIELLKGVLHG